MNIVKDFWGFVKDKWGFLSFLDCGKVNRQIWYMTFVWTLLLLSLHAFVAWLLIEVFVNSFHGLKRFWYVLWHYLVVAVSFFIVFYFYFTFFAVFSVFTTMAIAMVFLFFIEVFIFRYLYSGELWFLNYTDWIVPVFLAASGIYFAGYLVVG